VKYSLVFLFVSSFLFFSCKVPLYLSPNEPIFKESHLVNNPRKETIKVLSYNIKFSLQIDKAIQELKTLEGLQDADIILLQEMNEHSTSKIAHALGYNYVYFPIVFYTKYDRNFGNAVLSKWPIVAEEKIIFPNLQFGNGTRRAATSVIIQMEDMKIRAISAHLATIMLPKKQKLEQIDSLLSYNALDQNDYQIVGGDYNTLTGEEADYVINAYKEKNYVWASQKIGPTGAYFKGFLKPWNDHIFTKGFKVVASGKADNITASDHYPIWVELQIE